jgi:hypothetical protein
MNVTEKDTLSNEGLKALEALRRSVAQALDRKRRLGHYAVIWRDGKPLATGEDLSREGELSAANSVEAN